MPNAKKKYKNKQCRKMENDELARINELYENSRNDVIKAFKKFIQC